MLLEAPENALAESESTLLCSRGAWKHLEVLRSTGEVDQSVWEVCVCLLDRFTFCWWTGFGETTFTQIHASSFALSGDRFDADSGCKACWTCKLLPLHEASLGNYHIEIRYRQRYGDGFHVARGIDSQIVSFEDLSLGKAIFVPTLLCISFFLISVSKLWDMIFHQCVCKGRTGHVNVLDSKSGW